jgi:hypothetical protein
VWAYQCMKLWVPKSLSCSSGGWNFGTRVCYCSYNHNVIMMLHSLCIACCCCMWLVFMLLLYLVVWCFSELLLHNMFMCCSKLWWSSAGWAYIIECWENVHDNDFHLWVYSVNFNLHVLCMTVKKLCLFCDFL